MPQSRCNRRRRCLREIPTGASSGRSKRRVLCAGLTTRRCRVLGLWGYALARSSAFEIPRNPPPGLKFLDDQTLTAMFTLSKDIEPVPVEINRLDNQVLVRYYEGEWKRFE